MRVTRQVKRAGLKRELAEMKRMLKEYRPLMEAMAIVERAKEEGYQAGLAAGKSKTDAAHELPQAIEVPAIPPQMS